MCRLCNSAYETQDHVVNCPEIADGHECLNLNILYGVVPVDNPTVREVVRRFEMFEERIRELGISAA